ncbi:unnamed protein product [Camellia sinensis]
MHNSAAEVAGVGDLQQPVRRRLVQSTLFPHRSQDNATEKEDKKGDQKPNEEEEEEEEYCPSQGKKKRQRKPRAPKKVAVNGKQIPSKKVDDKDCPAIENPDLFLKASEGQNPQKKQQCVASPEENDKTCSPLESPTNMKTPRQLKRHANSTPKKKQVQTTPRKKRVQTTPKKKIMNGVPEQISDSPIQSGNATQSIPDLRLEAKMKAEENARMFGGKQIHPFFLSQKMAKKNQETIDVESNCCSVERKDKSTIFSPIHVFENFQDDAGLLDWGNLILSERSFIGTHCDLKSACSSVFEGFVNPLNFDDILNLDPSRTSLLQHEAVQHEVVSLDQSPVQRKHRHAVSPPLSADEPVVHYELLKDIEVNWQDHEMEKADFFSGHVGCVRNSDVEWEGRFLHESSALLEGKMPKLKRYRTKMMAYYHGCRNHPENSLWTNKYLPEKAMEVCGNEESVNFLSEWLHLWHESGFRSSKDRNVGKKFIVQDDDYNCYQSDCDSENKDEENGLKNVLLVAGPVGSGKSAAVYACAKEQGFHVIEVNASDWRTRTNVMQRFGGGVESYWVQRTMETPVGSESKQILKSFPIMSNTVPVQGCDSEVIELIHLSDEEDLQNATGTPGKFVCKQNRTATDHKESKPLILFEDVDAILSEDHGLIATIQKLAETAKRPIILTSNSHNPVLPNNLDRLELCFTKPSLKELLCHVNMFVPQKKQKFNLAWWSNLLAVVKEIFVKPLCTSSSGARARSIEKDSEEQRTYRYGPLLFDLDAGHRILPKIIPWSYPSQLSEFVEKEITKSLLMMEESSKLMEVVKEGELNKNERQNRLKRHKSETDSIEAKKEAILRRHCFVQDGNEFASPCKTACEFSNSSGSPLAFTRRNVRRKLDTVLSSNSGNESLNDRFPVVGDKLFEDTNNEMFLEVDSKSLSYCLATETCLDPVPEKQLLLNFEGEKLEENFNPLPEQLLNFEGEKLQENGYNCSETAVCTQINGTRKSVEISCVPESSFVPETEINDGTSLLSKTISCDHIPDIAEAVSIFNDLIQNLQPVETNNLIHTSGLHKIPEMVENFDVYKESTHGEEVGDSHTEHVDALPRGYQVMDECSRMDFSRGAKSKDEHRSCMLMDSVQETWRRFRACHTDLRQYVTPKQKDASLALKLTYEMSNLISEADMLLGDCQPVICDSLDPSMVPSEKSHSFSWYDDQLWMASTIAQHGFCFYAKEIVAVGSNGSSVNRMDLALEMLASSTNTTALGKLVRRDRRIDNSEMGRLKSVISTKSELDSRLISVVQSIVPSRSLLATTKGGALYEYLSSLGQISRSEASRLSESIDNTKQKRVRVARNYLSTGALMFSPNDLSTVGKYNCYGRGSSQSMDASWR